VSTEKRAYSTCCTCHASMGFNYVGSLRRIEACIELTRYVSGRLHESSDLVAVAVQC